jgi:hypothetical protein
MNKDFTPLSKSGYAAASGLLYGAAKFTSAAEGKSSIESQPAAPNGAMVVVVVVGPAVVVVVGSQVVVVVVGP